MSRNKLSVKDFYDSLAADYDAEQDAANFRFVREPEKELIRDFFEKGQFTDSSILEIGAGTGRFSLLFAAACESYTAVDLSPAMLQQLTQKAEKAHITNITTIEGDFLQTPIPGTFDYIVSFTAIEYILDKKALFRKVAQLLKPSGKLFITTTHKTFIRFWGCFGNYFRQHIFMNMYSKREIKKLLQNNGLKPLLIEDYVLKRFPFKGILLVIHAQKD
ncbi:class I SAM-dependent methyltransferase [Treponema vincentii]|uniref:class I SAM-dependent methyltransferase n=1 Tax=Treponema vincentii TaxID=69710 RepID=UPI003D934F43